MLSLALAGLLCATPSDSSLWSQLRARYLGLRSLSGSFEETICSDEEGTCQSFAGSFWAYLPGRYRLEVAEPQRQIIVASDTVLWFYFPAEKRAVREDQPRSMPLLAFLDPVLDTLTTALVETDSNGTTVVHVESADEMAALQDLVLELDVARHSIAAFEFSDAWGNHYRFTLKAQSWNPSLPAALFEFTPPTGTIVE